MDTIAANVTKEDVKALLVDVLQNGLRTSQINAIFTMLDKLGWEEISPDERKYPEAYAA